MAAGVHCILDLYDCPEERLDDLTFVRRALHHAARQGRATLLREIVHRFEPRGVTALGLLAESHLAIHTWPESRYAAADLFTCGRGMDPQRACRYLLRAFRAGAHSLRMVVRSAAGESG